MKNIKPLTHQSTKRGFTMVELSLTLAFIGSLLITISIIVTNIVSIYQKGLTLKAVNSVGRGLVSELTTAINTAPSVDTTSLCNSLSTLTGASRDECIKNRAFKYIYQANYDSAGAKQYSGVFCTGFYSYIWNTYYGREASHGLSLKYQTADGTSHDLSKPRLARIEDHNYRVCSAVVDNNYNSTLSADQTIDITTLSNTSSIGYYVPEPTEGMLSEFDLDLELYELVIFPLSQDSVTLRTFLSGTFVLATTRGDVDVTRSGDYCSLGTEAAAGTSGTSSLSNLGAEFNYCAINKFNFAARTAGV